MDPDIRRLSRAGYSVGVAVNAGGTLVALDWTDRAGTIHRLFRTGNGTGWSGGPLPYPSSFPMIPFANRIDAGRFTFEERPVAVPVNRPDTGVAIHGFSYANPWRLVEETNERLLIAQEFEGTQSPYSYKAEQAIEISAGELIVDLKVTNEARCTLPFGFGHHPWLELESETFVTFGASHTFSMDERRLPVSAMPAESIADFRNGADVSQLPGIDTCFAGWERTALVEWRRRGVRLRIEAAGAFCCLHVYTPPDQKFFCLEQATSRCLRPARA
jgi:aldose 1-epimerase